MRFLASVLLALWLIGIVSAVSQTELLEAEKLIQSNTSCTNLSNDQLELIGEYYMEKMHPGETHALMHKMMGLEEGTEDEELFHINLAKTIYCETDQPAGMMGRFGGGGMMGYGGMMSGYDGFGWINIIFWILMLIVLIFAIIWLYRNVAGDGRTSSALETLKHRYAKGEISKNEYEDMKKILSV